MTVEVNKGCNNYLADRKERELTLILHDNLGTTCKNYRVGIGLDYSEDIPRLAPFVRVTVNKSSR